QADHGVEADWIGRDSETRPREHRRRAPRVAGKHLDRLTAAMPDHKEVPGRGASWLEPEPVCRELRVGGSGGRTRTARIALRIVLLLRIRRWIDARRHMVADANGIDAAGAGHRGRDDPPCAGQRIEVLRALLSADQRDVADGCTWYRRRLRRR